MFDPFEAVEKGRKRAAEDYRAGREAKQQICAEIFLQITMSKQREVDQLRLIADLEELLADSSRESRRADAAIDVAQQRVFLATIRGKIAEMRKLSSDTGCDGLTP
jgi:hypothetical protein